MSRALKETRRPALALLACASLVALCAAPAAAQTPVL